MNPVAIRFISPLGVMVAIAVILSLSSFLHFYMEEQTLMYPDAKSHMMIAKRFWHSPTPGWGQLGVVWLILTHVLMLPTIWNDTLYYTGISGSIVSMACYVGTVPYLYKTVEKISGRTPGAIIASLVFMLNPNVLYMQTTPMTEVPLFFFMMAAIYYSVTWLKDTEKIRNLFLAGLMFTLASLVRYEAWVFLAVSSVALVYFCRMLGFSREKIEAHMIWGGAIAFFGIAFWVGWNVAFKNDPLYFQFGEYSKPSLWVGTGDKAVGDIQASILTYWYAMIENFSLPIILLAGAGVFYFAVSSIMTVTRDSNSNKRLLSLKFSARSKSEKTGLIVLTLLFPIPFFILALYQGQRPMHVAQINDGDLYNVRFALIMVLAISVFIGYLARKGFAVQAISLTAILTMNGLMWLNEDIITLQDPLGDREDTTYTTQIQTAQWLKSNYDDGYVLAENFGNETVQFDGRIPPEYVLYEGSNNLWEPALQNPSVFVTWVIVRYGGAVPDAVASVVNENPAILSSYEVVYENDLYRIYRKPADPSLIRR